jgi:hypothetical protein
MNDLEAFEQFWVSSGTTNREDKLEAWEAALEYEREKHTLKEAQRNRVFVEMARQLHEKQQETHLMQLKNMLKSIGFDGIVEEGEDKDAIDINADFSSDRKKVHGYQGFTARFEFNKDGSLNNVGIYE